MNEIKVLSVGAAEWRDLTPGGTPAEGTPLSLWIEGSELDRLLAAYDPSSGTSPSVSDARPVLRAILDAVLAARSGGQS
jgi:hypothetical protein